MTLNVAIVGPGRSRQGTGPFVARSFFELGACISGVVSRSSSSAARAVEALNSDFGIVTEGFSSLELLVRSKPVDVVAICSPIDSHRRYLQIAIDAGLHIFCEKPLWWPSGGIGNRIDPERINIETKQLVQRCKEGSIYLHLNTQWPFTLPAYYELCSSRKPAPAAVNSFEMWLCPSGSGTSMVVDSVPHLLSMVYALVGSGRIRNIEAKWEPDSTQTEIDIGFDYLHLDGETRVSLSLRSTNEVPRPAAFAVNGVRADRHVEPEDYVISFRTQGAILRVADPLFSSVEEFLNRINSASTLDETELVDSMEHLVQIYHSVRTN